MYGNVPGLEVTLKDEHANDVEEEHANAEPNEDTRKDRTIIYTILKYSIFYVVFAMFIII